MNDIHTILAKSKSNGGTTLIEHTEQVIAAITKFAEVLDFDVHIAVHGAILHDIGKCHPEFQEKLITTSSLRKINASGIPLRHEITSLLFLPFFPEKEWPDLIDMIVAHHKPVQYPTRQLRGKGLLDIVQMTRVESLVSRHLGDEKCLTSATEILRHFGLKGETPDKISAEYTIRKVIKHCQDKGNGCNRWRGLLMLADHFASALGDQTEEKLQDLFKRPDLTFFKDESRANKLFPLSTKETTDSRPHTIVTAPTGAGKTDFLLKRCSKRVFYVLPFQASINAMYDRLKDACGNDNIQLLHAASRLKVEKGKGEKFESDIALQSLAGAAIKVLTPHQLASVCFGSHGYEALSLDLREQDIILDEIHSYSEATQALVLELIKTLKMLQCNIHIGTATMPSLLKEKVITLLGGASKVYEVQLSESELQSYTRHKVHKLTEPADSDRIIADAVRREEKVLVVSNRVAKAQSLYASLKEQFPYTPMLLLHSRFKRGDRSSLERKLMNDTDKANGPCIVVSTQVVEVSLDISFDLLVTECAPIDSLIQRFGRINRRRTKETIGKTKPVFVTRIGENKRETLPYEPDTISATWEALPDGIEIQETQWQQLIDQVYNSIEFKSFENSSIYNEQGVRIKELTNYPKNKIIEELQISSGTCIIASDKEIYLNSRGGDRLQIEIPIPWYKLKKYAERFEQLEYGTAPAVIPDWAYDSEAGLHLELLDKEQE